MTLCCLFISSLLALPAVQANKRGALLEVLWNGGPTLPGGRSGSATVVLPNGSIVVFGGVSANALSVNTLAPGAVAWVAAPQLQNSRYAPGAVSTGNNLVTVIGGRGNNNRAMKEVMTYDPATGRTSGLSSLNSARYLFATTNGPFGIYAIGGHDDTAVPLASVERLNTVTGKWTGLATLPEGRYTFPAVSNGDNVFTFGGATAAAPATATVNRYTASTNTWDTVAPMPVATQGSTAVLGANNLVYVIGGSDGTAPLNTVQIYNLANNTWTLGAPLPVAVTLANAVLDTTGQLVVIGGVDASNNNVSFVWTSPQADIAPVIISLPNTNATVGQLYGTGFSATGNPAPTYTLLAGPTGMVMNPVGGLTWTPDVTQIGTANVTVRASNNSGFDDQSFTINVAPPAPTGLTVTNVTANTVSLAWNPLPPEAGTVSYTLFDCSQNTRSGLICRPIASDLSATTITVNGLVTGTLNKFVVTDTVNGTTSARSAVVAAVTLQPAPPTNFTLAAVTQNTATLTWIPPTNSQVPVVAYRVQEFATGVGFVVKGDNLTDTRFTVGGLLTNSTHLFYVNSLDADGNQSFNAGPLTVTTNSVPVLTHNPTVFTTPVSGVYPETVAAVIGDQLMVVSPAAHVSAGMPYVISAVGLPAPAFSLVNAPSGMTIDPVTGVVSWTNVSGTPGSYTATVRGTNIEGFSDFTFSYTIFPAGTDLLAPVAVQNFAAMATNITNNSVTLTWPTSTDNAGVAGYNVFIVSPALTCVRSNCQPLPNISPVAITTGTSATLNGLPHSTSYSFWIQAFDAAGNTSYITPGQQRSFTTLQ